MKIASQLLSMSLLCLLFSTSLFSQETGLQLKVNPQEITLAVGETTQLTASVVDENGEIVKMEEKLRYYARNSRFADADSTGLVKAHQPGEATIIVLQPFDGKFLRADVPIAVKHPPVAKITFDNVPDFMYTGLTMPVATTVYDQLDFERPEASIAFSTSNEKTASFDDFNNLTAYRKGKVTLVATIEGIVAEKNIEIRQNPVAALELNSPVAEAKTGDVIQFSVQAFDADGKLVEGVPVAFSFSGKASNPMDFANGLIEPDGRFVAYHPGMYTVTAACGNATARKAVRITDRREVIQREIEMVGRGKVTDKHTSDLWVWEGADGRDYAVTGTWGADGEAFFWDVTDPANIVAIDTVQVDARTVNDVKVSEDGTICVISREGASNRKNGIIILDVTDPANVRMLSQFTDGLTGGVHNLFIYQKHVFALSNAERYDIISIQDPANPQRVGTFELDSPGHSIHDVWVVDGIAYSSNWHDGVQVVDVGNGIAGGTPAKPVKIGSYAYPSGWNHAAFPYKDESTGKFYIIAGDEAFPNGLYIKDKPTIPAGWLHFIDFTDPLNPKEVAKYEVEGAGSHNYWVEGDVLYVANYNAGLRVVDISGDLMGDLRKQGREIGWFLPTDPQGVVPNAAMTWGPQPHKGNIFFSDWNSGLWSVKIKQPKLEN